MARRWPNPVSAPRSSPPRDPHRRLIGNRSHLGPGTDAFMVEIQGANALADHFYGFAASWNTFAVQLLDVSSDIGIEEAQRLVHVDTGQTRDSINKSPGVTVKADGEWSVRYGPTTFYAPFLEYGTIRTRPYPFMIPSGDLAEAAFVPAVLGVLNILTNSQLGSGGGLSAGGRVLGDQRIRGSFTGLRSWLYSTEKFLGDVAVFGGRSFIGPVRGLMLSLARALGDVSSIMNSTINTRVSNRLHGRVTGHIIGFGSASLSFSKTYSAFPGGASGHRIYQRIAGRYSKVGFSTSAYRLVP